MTDVIGCSVDMGKKIYCPNHDIEKVCKNKKCRFWEFCKAVDEDFGDDDK